MATTTVVVKLFILPLLLPSACARNISLRCWEDVGAFLSDLNIANPKPYAVKTIAVTFEACNGHCCLVSLHLVLTWPICSACDSGWLGYMLPSLQHGDGQLLHVVTGSFQSASITGQFINQYIFQLHNFNIAVYDSAGKPSSNILSGNTDRLGSYSECISAVAPSGRFQGQYCKLQLKQDGIDYYNGLCVPDSCHEEEITTLAIQDIFKFKTISFLLPFPSPFALNSTVSLTTVTRCAKDLFPIDAFVAVCFFLSISFIVLPIIGTIYTAYIRRRTECNEFPSGSLSSTNYGSTSSVENEVGKSKGEKKRSHYGTVSAWLAVVDGPRQTFLETLDCILKSFSLQKTLSAIWQVKPSRDVSLVLNGIRSLSLLWVISGHTSQMTAWQNLDNTLEWEAKVLKNPIYIYSRSGPFYLSVDTFFLISGMLSSQSFLNMLNHSGKEVTCSIALKYLGNRFLRLQPLHLYSVCLLVGLYSVVPWGALWEPAKLQVENCRTLWGANLLLINNFFPGSESCNGWTWYLANDFQFCFTTPLLVLSCSRSKHGLLVTGAVLFLGTFTVTALLSSFYQLPVANPEDMRKMSTVMYFKEYYSKPYCRYGPYLVGILLGLFIYHQQTPILRTKVQASVGWLCSLSSMFMVVALAYSLEDSLQSYSPAVAIYQAIHRTVWAIAVGWVIFACEEGYGGFVTWLLSWDIWAVVARISYACYLVHPMLILLYNGLQETLMHYSDVNMLYLFIGHCLMTVIVGLALTVMIEIPLEELKRSFTCSHQQRVQV